MLSVVSLFTFTRTHCLGTGTLTAGRERERVRRSMSTPVIQIYLARDTCMVALVSKATLIPVFSSVMGLVIYL